MLERKTVNGVAVTMEFTAIRQQGISIFNHHITITQYVLASSTLTLTQDANVPRSQQQFNKLCRHTAEQLHSCVISSCISQLLAAYDIGLLLHQICTYIFSASRPVF